MQIVMKSLGEIHPNENNAKKHDARQIKNVAESIKQYGFVQPCLYGWKSGAGHLWASDRKQTTVLEFDRPTKNKEHPTMKPVALFDYQIKNNTKGGDAVLDLFAGSGTTVIACEQNGRDAYAMEFDPRYCDVIVKRWETLTGNRAVLLNDN